MFQSGDSGWGGKYPPTAETPFMGVEVQDLSKILPETPFMGVEVQDLSKILPEAPFMGQVIPTGTCPIRVECRCIALSLPLR